MLYMNFEFIICQKNIRKHDISRSTSNMYKLACVELRKECVVMWKKKTYPLIYDLAYSRSICN